MRAWNRPEVWALARRHGGYGQNLSMGPLFACPLRSAETGALVLGQKQALLAGGGLPGESFRSAGFRAGIEALKQVEPTRRDFV